MLKYKPVFGRLAAYFVFILCLSYSAKSQTYGYEWIKPYQPYYKFLVGKTATYRISVTDLQNAGINLAVLNPKRVQLFCMGKEVPVYIFGESDNVFNTNDFIEFLGYKNSGAVDADLFSNPSWQPNLYNGLFTDTTAYYLTILPDTTVQVPLRYSNVSENNFSGLQAEQYFIDTLVVAPTDEYLDGPDLMNATEKYVSSEYEEGEGWAGVRVGWNNPTTYTFNTTNYFSGGPAPTLTYKTVGASNASIRISYNHHLAVDISPDGSSFTNLTDFSYSGYATNVFNPILSASNIGTSNTFLRMRAINDLQVASDYSCLSYAALTFPRTFNQLNLSRFIAVNHQQGGARSFVQMQVSGNPVSVVVYDLQTNKRIQTVINSGNAEFAITNDSKAHQLWLFDSTQTSPVGSIRAVSFPTVDPSLNYEFIIVTHPNLEPAATNYKEYRSTSYSTIKVYSEQLYDYYFYGNKHPLAIKRMVKHLMDAQSTPPKYLLLAGRGYQNDKARFYNVASPTPIANYNKNLVPGIGVPGADALFTSGIKGDGFYAELGTGRIPATTSQELQNYLDKLVTYELGSDSIEGWRKNILHVSGGTDANQQATFKAVLGYNAGVIAGQQLGAKVTSYNKTTNSPTQADLRDKLIAAQNRGVNLLSFFGHASLTILDVDIGTVGELSNQGKYPLYYFSGCNVGNATEVDIETGDGINAKDYICSANKGAIGWLAHSNFTFDGFLPPLINGFYSNYAQTSYGRPLGDIIKNVTKQLSNGSPVTKSHSIQWVLQGDPAARIYSPSAPDYTLKSSDIIVKNSNLSVQDEFVELDYIVSNVAKTSLDSFNVQVSRRMPNNQVIVYPIQRVPAVFNQDTFSIKVEMQGELALGTNVFEVKLDVSNEVNELFENNNTATLNLFVPGNGSSILYPQLDALLGNDTIWLTVQNNNILSTSNEFIIEVDTLPDFSSPFKTNSGVIQSGALLRYAFVPKNVSDSTTFYWRARLNLAELQGGKWVNGVFSYIATHEEGWMQRNFDRKIDLSGSNLLVVDTAAKRIDFTENSKTASLKANRLAHGGRGLYFDGENQNPFSLGCTPNGFFAILIDKRTLRMFINPKFPLNCQNVINNNNNPALRKLFYYGFPNTLAGQQDFQRFVDSADAGTYVAIWSVYDNGNANWTPETRAAFGKLGSVKVANTNNSNTAFCMMGIVGAQPGTIAEDTLSILATDTNAQVNTILYGKWFTASATSRIIGPAKQWKRAKYYLNQTENDGNDFDKVTIRGIRADNTDTLLFADAANSQDLSGVDASQYPYLKLSYTLFDTMYRTPNQLNYWMVSYQPAAEGTISVSDGYSFYNPQLEKGDSLRLTIAFKNVYSVALDSVPLHVIVLDANRIIRY